MSDCSGGIRARREAKIRSKHTLEMRTMEISHPAFGVMVETLRDLFAEIDDLKNKITVLTEVPATRTDKGRWLKCAHCGSWILDPDSVKGATP